MGFKKQILLFTLVLLYPFVSSIADSKTYSCLEKFHRNFSREYQASSYKSHITDYEIKKGRVGKQNVMVANLIDPVDDKRKKLFVTKTKARVCDPTAERGSRCIRPSERHLNASLERHISVLPDVYKNTLRSLQAEGEDADLDTTKSYRPGDVINRLGDCKRVSKKLRRRIMNKSRALATIYNQVIKGVSGKGPDSIENNVSPRTQPIENSGSTE